MCRYPVSMAIFTDFVQVPLGVWNGKGVMVGKKRNGSFFSWFFIRTLSTQTLFLQQKWQIPNYMLWLKDGCLEAKDTDLTGNSLPTPSGGLYLSQVCPSFVASEMEFDQFYQGWEISQQPSYKRAQVHWRSLHYKLKFGINKQIYPQKGISFSNKKEWNTDNSNMSEYEDNYTKWKKPDEK